MAWKTLLLLLLAAGVGALYLFGRPLWNPVYVKLGGQRTVAEVVAVYGGKARERLKPSFDSAGVQYPPQSIALLAIKDTGVLELWSIEDTQRTLIKSYPIKAHSGVAGPKLREGDRQVPEGLYKIIGLNPNSSFHLSMKLNYPNEFDLVHAEEEGRDQPGTNIFIHGKASSVGCLAMGDPAIEELFVLVSDVGRHNVTVAIAPSDPRRGSLARITQLPWTDELYRTLETAFADYQ